VERESLFEEAAVARETREGDRERGGRRTFFVGGVLGAWATENSLFFLLVFVLFCDTLLPGRDMRVTKEEGEESRKKKKSQKRGEKIQTPFGLFPRSLSFSLPSLLAAATAAAEQQQRLLPLFLARLFTRSLARSLAYLLDGDLALHAGALVRLAVVGVLSGGGQLDRVRLPGRVEVVLVRERLGVDARRHGVLVKDDVVREAGVVTEGQRVPGLDGDRGRVEDERARVGAEVDGGVGVGGEGEREPGDAGSGALEEAVIYFIFLEVERGGGGS
jgi:hypothetical protein